MRQAVQVARIQTVNSLSTLGMPWGILVLAFIANLIIFGMASGIPTDSRSTGAIMSIYIVTLIANLQTMTQVFPFAVGLSVTRRAFFAGTGLLIAAQSLASGVLLTLLLELEQATGGWGLQLQFFGLPFLLQSNWFAQVLVYTAPFLLIAFVGIAVGTVFKRWGQNGMFVLSVSAIVVVTGLAVLITWQQWWDAVGSFFTDTSGLALVGGYPLVLAAAVAGLAYLGMRRATP